TTDADVFGGYTVNAFNGLETLVRSLKALDFNFMRSLDQKICSGGRLSLFGTGKAQRVLVANGYLIQVKEKQEKDKIGSKPDKNGKRVKAGKNLKQLQWVEQEKLSKTQKNGQKRKRSQKLFKL
nr:hypothetical protein [Tanacetum cinerariifolium]